MLKRVIDIFFSLILILLFLPVVFSLLIIVFFDLRSVPVFKQKRAGLNGKPFYIMKIKTMTDCKDQNGKMLSDDIRLTRVGNIIRKYSLDELPQLVNVFIGDMSFIGPRPFLYEYMSVYSESEKKRHNVRPGISGWAQVNGRNNLSWKEKFKLDIYYVENISVFLDFKILVLTFYKIIKNSDINQSNNLTMEKYNGKN